MNEKVKKMFVKQATPFLKEGEVVRHLFQGRRGDNPWVVAWSTILPLRFPRLVVATDNALVILSTRWFGRPESVIARLDRATKLGEPRFSPWALVFLPLLSFRWIRLNDERLWVATRDTDEVRAIDAERVGA